VIVALASVEAQGVTLAVALVIVRCLFAEATPR
jgi:hypothetical protein